MTQSAPLVRSIQHADILVVIDIFRASVRLVARRNYTQDQVMAWAPDEIDPAAWTKRYDTRQAWVADAVAVDLGAAAQGGATRGAADPGDAVARSGIVGFIELEGRDHLDMLYVHPAHQRQGVATALLEHLELAARGLGARRLRTEASITARPFFERRGFRLVAEQTVAVRGQSFINYRMEKQLGDPD